jgi:hypothetical protein
MRPWNDVVPLLLDHAGNFDRLGCPFEDVVWSLKDKPRRAGGQEPMRKCPACGGFAPLSRVVCPHCGADLPRPEAGAALAETDAQLRERQTEPEALKWAFFWRQVVTAKSRGFKPGFASAIFKERYGEWPPKHWSQKIKTDFATDGLWQDLLARRLARKAEREVQALREEQAMVEAAREEVREVSEEERALERTIEAIDAPVDGYEEHEAPFADWIDSIL